jgi:predicted dehydrogenase
VPAELELGPPDPPPADLLVSAYDQLHAFGIDLPPWVRMAEAFAGLIAGRPVPADPRPATFADGVADMVVLDAIRRSAAERAWVAM